MLDYIIGIGVVLILFFSGIYGSFALKMGVYAVIFLGIVVAAINQERRRQ
jgi:hypothetical protein